MWDYMGKVFYSFNGCYLFCSLCEYCFLGFIFWNFVMFNYINVVKLVMVYYIYIVKYYVVRKKNEVDIYVLVSTYVSQIVSEKYRLYNYVCNKILFMFKKIILKIIICEEIQYKV